MSRPFHDDYAVIALTEPLRSRPSVMVMAGITEYGTQAAAEFLCREDTVNSLLTRLKVSRGGRVPPFEAVLHTRIVSGVPVGSEVVLLTTVADFTHSGATFHNREATADHIPLLGAECP